jgi:hypothetical protein
MALKPDRNIVVTDISNLCNIEIEKGEVLVFGVSGSGALADDVATVTRASNPSGLVPAGLCLADVVSIDITRQHRNWHKDEQLVGEKVPLLTKGWVVTDKIASGVSPAAGESAYLAANGLLTDTQTSGTPKVGQFLGGVDSDGYAKVFIDLPIV